MNLLINTTLSSTKGEYTTYGPSWFGLVMIHSKWMEEQFRTRGHSVHHIFGQRIMFNVLGYGY